MLPRDGSRRMVGLTMLNYIVFLRSCCSGLNFDQSDYMSEIRTQQNRACHFRRGDVSGPYRAR